MSSNAQQIEGSPLLLGIRVLGLGGVGPAARVLRILADYGAMVWLIGRPAGAGSESWELPFHSYAGGRGWRRAEMDLSHPAGREAFLSACSDTDVVIDGLRPGAVDRLGIGSAVASERNPRLIWCAASGYGTEGPYAGWAGHDINYAGLAGFAALAQRRSDGGPPLAGVGIADAAGGGMHAAIAVLAALVGRSSSGHGAVLDCSATDGMVALMALALDERLAAGIGDEHVGGALLRGEFACYDHYEAADGGWLAIGAIEPRFFANLCAATGLDHLVDHQYDRAAQDRLRAELALRLRQRPRDHWVEALGHLDTCVTPVLELEEVLADRHLVARGLVVQADHPIHGRFRQLGPALAGTQSVGEPVRLPSPGASETRSLLLESGMELAAIDRLANAGIIR